MKNQGLYLLMVLASMVSLLATPSFASQEAPKFCLKLKTAEDLRADHIIRRWDFIFPKCIGHIVGDGKSVEPGIFDVVYRTALQYQNGIREDREKALEYYKLLLRDQNRDWRQVVSYRVDEYVSGLTSLGYPYRSSAQVLAESKQKSADFEREVNGKKQISIGETGTIEIPEHLSIGQKFVAVVGAAIIADVARGLSGESLPQDVQEVHDRFNEHQRYIQEREFSTWATGAAASYLP